MTIKEVADLTGVSVRTLHHYDAIGLLSPQRKKENEYRLYSDADLDKLQQILFFRACGFPLKSIQELLNSPQFNRMEAFLLQKESLLYEKKRIETLINTLDKNIEMLERGIPMDQDEKFSGFSFDENPFEKEARERWGDELMDAANEKINQFSEKGRSELGPELSSYFEKLSELQTEEPASTNVQNIVKELYGFFNKIGNYTPQAFASVGKMYVTDERFKKTMSTFGDKFPEFASKAMALFAEKIS